MHSCTAVTRPYGTFQCSVEESFPLSGRIIPPPIVSGRIIPLARLSTDVQSPQAPHRGLAARPSPPAASKSPSSLPAEPPKKEEDLSASAPAAMAFRAQRRPAEMMRQLSVRAARPSAATSGYQLASRQLHNTASLQKVIPFKLPDIGEGIAEVEILQVCAPRQRVARAVLRCGTCAVAQQVAQQVAGCGAVS